MSWFSDITSSIGDIFSPVKDLVSGGLSLFGQSETNAANAQQAQEQMDFQERMSGTSYQRAVKDLQAAGLNPVLAYSAGGASTPSGAQATMQNSLGAGVSSAQTQARLTADIDNIKADTAAKKTAADLNIDKSWTERASQDLLTQQVEAQHIANELSKGVNPSKIKEATASSAAAVARLPIAKSEGGAAGTWYGRNVMPYLPSVLQGAHSASSVA